MSRRPGTRRRFWRRRLLIDPRFATNRQQYIFQCLLVTVTIAIVLMLLDSFHQTVLIAALGASSTVAFAAPSLRASRPRCLVGGYVVGTLVGILVSLLASALGGATVLMSIPPGFCWVH